MTLFITSAIRINVGTDFSSYEDWFRRISAGEETYFEASFSMLSEGIALFTNNPQWLFAISALITLTLIYVTVKKYSVNPALSIFLLSTMSFYFASFNGIRQFIAISIVFFAFGYLIKRKWLRYLIAIIVASTFHMTALLMIPIYFLVNLNYKKIHYFIVAVVSSLSILFRETLMPFMTNLYPMYQDNVDYLYRISFSEIFILTSILLMSVMGVLFYKGMMSYKKTSDRIIFNLTFYSLILHTCFAWVPAINRIGLYIDIAFILIIPFVLAAIRDKYWRYLLTTLLMIFYAVYLVISVGANNSHDVLPYTSVLSELI